MAYQDQVAESLYKSGIGMIRSAIDDAEAADKTGDLVRCLIAIRSVYSGILLILKSRLAEASAKDENALIYSDFTPVLQKNGRVCFEHSDRTVDFEEIKARLKQLNPPVAASIWAKLGDLRKFRNAAEHKFVEYDQSVVSGHLFSAHEIIAAILKGVVEISPKDALGDRWKKLLSITAVAKEYAKQRKTAFNKLQWFNPRLRELALLQPCSACGYTIVLLAEDCTSDKADESTFKCASCHHVFEYPEWMEEILQSQTFDDFGGRWKDEYLADRHIGCCPDCGRYGFDVETDMCYCCGFKKEYYCDCCGNKLRIDEVEECGDPNPNYVECFGCRYRMEKDD